MKRGSFFLREAQSESPKRIRKDVEHLFYVWDRKKNVIPLYWMQTQDFIVLYLTSFVPLAGVEVHVPYELDRGSDAVGKKSISTPNFRRDYVYDLSSPLYDSRIQVISCSATLLEKSSEG